MTSDDRKRKPGGSGQGTKPADRKARQAEALRANLRRRGAQRRAREEAGGTDDGTGETG